MKINIVLTMKMKTIISFLSKITLMVITCISLASCPDDNIVEGDNLLEVLQKNKWVGHDTWAGEAISGHAWVDLETTTLYFTSDNKGMLYLVVKDYDTDLGNTTSKSWTLFDYTVSGTSVYITFETNDRITLKYDGDYLVNGQYDSMYKKTALSSGDYEIINNNRSKEDKCGASLSYKFDSRTGVLEISGTGKMNDYTTSNQPWKSWNVKKLVVNEGCTYIGENAFRNMICITDVDLANSIEEIGPFAFDNLTITSVDLPSKVRIIGKAAFGDCNYLKDVSFYGCNQLEKIGDQAFSGCPLSLSYFTLPSNVTTVGDYAFSDAKFSSLTLNEKLETVGKRAFNGISNKKLEIPNSVKSIGLLAFQGSINEIVIGTGMRKIERFAFSGSSSGKISVNLGVPLTDVDQAIICNPSGDIADSNWTLVVPVGSKSSYQQATVWKNFKSIAESSSLVSGNGTPSGNGDDPNDPNDYNTYTGKVQGHGYVDLGLSVKWATCNIGATKSSDAGIYYCWGMTTGTTDPSSISDWEWNNRYKDLYDSNAGHSVYLGSDIKGTKYDAAYVNWGDKWRMPTRTEWNELREKCTKKWSKVNGVEGMVVIGPNGNSIFIPAVGESCTYSSDSYVQNRGYYWTSTVAYDDGLINTIFNCAISAEFSYSGSSSYHYVDILIHNYLRKYALTIRAVTQ